MQLSDRHTFFTSGEEEEEEIGEASNEQNAASEQGARWVSDFSSDEGEAEMLQRQARRSEVKDYETDDSEDGGNEGGEGERNDELSSDDEFRPKGRCDQLGRGNVGGIR